ncbi:uncharacterized protein LOC132760342 [Ruditapes philippinarum]|uniref:uncharacterized protein LOC132760342 n=1 Tax=Ruditapes philippinarum TaxID=129788 RepID=UPI00295B367D|nr:uncharacterized protein LOC132760342 [Ruditapes philippinarum]
MFKFDGVGYAENFKRPMDTLRPRSKSEGLVRKTLDFARVYSDADLHKTERNLEAEIRRESCIPPRDRKVARLRLKGERMLHSKFVLLSVVVLNLIDCALVLGELILDIHFIREYRTYRDETSKQFIDKMQARYPQYLHGHTIDHMDLLFDQMYLANCRWYDEYITETTTTSVTYVDLNKTQRHERRAKVMPPTSIHNKENEMGYTIKEITLFANNTAHHDNYTKHSQNYTEYNEHHLGNHSEYTENNTEHSGNYTEYTVDNSGNHSEHTGNHTEHLHGDHGHHHHEHSIWEHVAHGMHKASITILGILFVENLTKLVCMGKAFLIKKLEVFDAIVVFISFVVDLVLLKGLMNLKVQDAVFILTFLLPWRVIRVVNSLIVAVLDHEHFRLKMLYQEKKAVTAELKTLKAKEKGWDFHLKKIEHFCESEGIPKWKIRQHTAMGRKQSTITTMASLALNGFLKGMVTSPSDKILFERTLAQSSQDNSSLGIITESDTTEDNNDDDITEISISVPTGNETCPVTSEGSGNYDSISGLVMIENGHTENKHLGLDEGHMQVSPEHGIRKNESRKSVTFLPKEKKPLIRKQASFDDSKSDDGNFTGWK